MKLFGTLVSKKILIIIIAILVIGVTLTGIILFKTIKVNKIKTHYGETIAVLKDTNVYQKNDNKYTSFGSVLSGMEWNLDSISIESSKQTYFKVKDEDFYVFYKDVKPIEKKRIDETPDYYLPLNKQVITKGKTKFYLGEKVFFEVSKEYQFRPLYENESFYFVSYFDKILKLEKDKVEVKDIEKVNSTEEAEFVNIFHFPVIEDSLKNDFGITKEKTSELLNIMNEQNYYTISDEEYTLWLKGFNRLKKGATLITSENKSEEFLNQIKELNYNISSNTDFRFINNNSTTKKDTKIEGINRYFLNQNITKEQFNKMLEGKTVMVSSPNKATKIPVLNYHFFYDASKKEQCDETICLDVSKFRGHLDYLKKNKYKTLTMEEYRAWIYGEIDLPSKSVLITIDDGAMGTGKNNGNKLIPLLEEYKMHATLFLISGWWDKSNYVSNYLEIQSHTNDMHNEGICKEQPRGAQMLCYSKEQVMDDLNKSILSIGSAKAFCFPFYLSNDSTIQSVKDAGFKLAFVDGERKSSRSSDKYRIPRYVIYSYTTLNQLMKMLN